MNAMNLLAIDASTEYLSLALQVRGQVHAYHAQAGATASQLILPQIQALLTQANAQLSDLHGIAFGAGPGAFTGVRVACGVAQGLAFGANLPVVGINTLEALAQASGADNVIACLDARMGEIYHAAFVKQVDGWLAVSASVVCKPENAPLLDSQAWVGAGSGWAAYAGVLSALYQSNLTRVVPQIYPTATAILQLAAPVFAAGKSVPAHEAAPVYVRNRVALTTLERAQGQTL
jgi:tRNA threonylcarbamoyladenosine biosynthesis protein TsaB